MNILRRREERIMDLVKALEQEQLKNEYTDLAIGDYVKVHHEDQGRKQRKDPDFRRDSYSS
jgi:hypothetical protein